MKPHLLAENNWKNVQNNHYDLVVLPWGATEAHNYHLPYGTDNFEVAEVAAQSAALACEKGAKVIVLPLIPFGVNTGQADIYLNINLNPSTQMAILKDVVQTLNRHGIKRLLILNSHGGNDFKQMIREIGLQYPEIYLCSANWYQALDRKKYFDNPGDHADEVETSVMLHLYPELVLPPNEWGKGLEKKHRIKDFSEGWVWAERKWSEITVDTGVGNPELATKEKGEHFFNDVTAKIGNFMVDLCLLELSNKYE